MSSEHCLVFVTAYGASCCTKAPLQQRPMGLEIEAPTPDKHEKGAGRLEGGTA